MKIGITGHQKLPEQLIVEWLNKELLYEINRLQPVSSAYSSLAIGADQLFSKAVLQSRIDLIAVIPCQRYEETFKGFDQNTYFDLLTKCSSVETLNFELPSEEAFFSAGKDVAERSDILFAIWDGKIAKGLGGTGDIVQYALTAEKKVVHFNPVSREKSFYN